MLEVFPTIVFIGEARHLEDRLVDAAMGKAFFLQGEDYAKSFKGFNADNIRDTMGGDHLDFFSDLAISSVRMMGQFAKPRSDPLGEKNEVKLPSYRGTERRLTVLVNMGMEINKIFTLFIMQKTVLIYFAPFLLCGFILPAKLMVEKAQRSRLPLEKGLVQLEGMGGWNWLE
ncbi:hypothetical protein ACLOJK_033022 [Asimina triloba]